MILANGAICVLTPGSCGAFPANYCSSLSYFNRIAVHQKPLSSGALNLRLAKKRWDLDAGSTKCRICCALANEEVDSGSVTSRFLEKEFKFSPAFDDYVKVLESVRIDRSKDSVEDEGGFNSKRSSIGKRKSVRMNRQLREDKADDSEEMENLGENNSRGERNVRRGRDKGLKGKAGLTRNRSNGGRSLAEEPLEKGTARRIGDMNKNKLDNNSKSSNSRALRKFNLQSKANYAGENVDNDHLEKGKVSYFERSKGMHQKESKVLRVGKLEITKRDNGKMDQRSNGSFMGRKFSHGNPVVAHEKLIEPRGRWSNEKKLSGNISHHEDGCMRDNQSYRNNVGKMHDYTTNNLSERLHSVGSNIHRKSREPEIINDKQNTKAFYEGNMSKKGFGSNIDEKIHLMMDHGETETRSRRNQREFELEDDYDWQNKHVGKQTNHIEHRVKQNTFASPKKFDEQGRNKRHVGIHDNGYNATDMHDKGFKNASEDVDDYDFEDRAAFKTFEVFTDVRNRPRVLRMELEERIQKLAKQLHATDINIPQWKFSKMIHSAKIKFTDHSILRIIQILGAFGNWRRVLQVVEWLQSQERFKSYKSRYIYTSVLDVLGKARRPIEALNIFHVMRQGLSSYPDLAAYHCIATTLGQAGLMKALFDVIDCMRAPPEKKFNLGPLQKWDPRLEPDLVVYNAVLNACVQRKQWEGAFWVLQQLKEHGIKPSNTTYGLVMEVMLACGKYDLVYEFFRKVEKKSIPGVLNYKVLVNALWREGKIDEAVAAVKDMERRGIVGTASLYYDLARCLCSVGRCQEALLQMNKICKVAKKPLVVTYTGLIQACIDSGSIENATFIFKEMHKFCSPNIITCNIMLKSYIDHGMFEEAKDLFLKLLDGDYQITNRVGLTQKVAPDKFTFNTMMEACAQMQKWDDFENAYRQMLNYGHHFDTRRHQRLVLDAFRAGKVQLLELTWKHLVHFQRVPPPPIIKERFCIKLMEDDPVGAVSCIDFHQEIDIRAFSERSWLNLLNSYVDRIRGDTILRLTHELETITAQNVEVLAVYEHLRKACRQFVFDLNTSPALPHHPEVPCNT
ncbi:pentatricopeptide repeat-containing protein [Canna indica]|uniref:Pentatricopeptide repeat-containing protein n=1 Tax=Canna indica TaxID=4628 RepID=A0AAQ3Q8Q5_9LILI|nr:pentatricopeptide repeat-containing protein [Canna indica]